MNKKSNIIKIASIVLLIIILSLFYLFKNSSQHSIQSKHMNVSPTPLFKESFFVKGKVIDFSQRLIFLSKSIKVDNDDARNVNCPSYDQYNQANLGFIVLDNETKANVTCYNDYQGGIFLNYTTATNEQKSILLSQNEGDAGDIWDQRAWMIKKDSNTITLTTVKLASSVDIDNEEKFSCYSQIDFYRWNKEKKDFEKLENHIPDFDLSNFTQPISVDQRCINSSNGQWLNQKSVR